MNVLYCRVSTAEQNTDRQRVNEKDYDLIIEDKCSGSIPFFEREGGKEIKKLIGHNVIHNIYVYQIDRLGRDLRDIINVIYYLNKLKIPVHFVQQGLRTLDENGNENPIAKMIISILGIVGEMEKNQIKERQKEGIKIAQMKGKYTGRQIGSKEDTLKFLSKPDNKKALEYLKKNYKVEDISKIVGIHTNTIYKIKKLAMAS